MNLLRRLKCRMQWCGGQVVSGTHSGVVWVGWRCETCGAIKHYAPAHGLPPLSKPQMGG